MGTVSTVAEAYSNPTCRAVYLNTKIVPFAAYTGTGALAIKAGEPVVLGNAPMQVAPLATGNQVSSSANLIGIASSSFTPGEGGYGSTDVAVYMPEPTSFYKIGKNVIDPSVLPIAAPNTGTLTPLYAWSGGGWTTNSANAMTGYNNPLAYIYNVYADGSLLINVGPLIGNWSND
ncbi:MAG: hypothetical protein IIZ04_01065 [Aeriscardovia sp.]|nr:hypothetical protein [Aeriscardovia sp.]